MTEISPNYTLAQYRQGGLKSIAGELRKLPDPGAAAVQARPIQMRRPKVPTPALSTLGFLLQPYQAEAADSRAPQLQVNQGPS